MRPIRTVTMLGPQVLPYTKLASWPVKAEMLGCFASVPIGLRPIGTDAAADTIRGCGAVPYSRSLQLVDPSNASLTVH